MSKDKQWRRQLRRYFRLQRDFLVGTYRQYLDDGLDHEEALEEVQSDFFELVVEEMAEAADDRARWDWVKRESVKEVLEERDGPVFRALIKGALNIATARLLGRRSGIAGYLTAVADVVEAAKPAEDPEAPSEAPTALKTDPTREPGVGLDLARQFTSPGGVVEAAEVVEPAEPRTVRIPFAVPQPLVDPGTVDRLTNEVLKELEAAQEALTDAQEAEPDSKRTALGRLKSLTAGDRTADRAEGIRPPEPLPVEDDPTDEEEESEPLRNPHTMRGFFAGLPSPFSRSLLVSEGEK